MEVGRRVLTPSLPDFDKANEILFRLGIIYKQQGKYQESLECFDRILRNPPSPLAHADIWFQIGHVYTSKKIMSAPRMPTSVSSRITLRMRRFSSGLAGFTIRTGPRFRTRTSPSCILQKVSKLVCYVFRER